MYTYLVHFPLHSPRWPSVNNVSPTTTNALYTIYSNPPFIKTAFQTRRAFAYHPWVATRVPSGVPTRVQQCWTCSHFGYHSRSSRKWPASTAFAPAKDFSTQPRVTVWLLRSYQNTARALEPTPNDWLQPFKCFLLRPSWLGMIVSSLWCLNNF